MSWLAAKPVVSSIIAGATKPEQIDANIASVGWTLTPEDLAVIGYDDREIAQFMRPPLTTILLPHLEMGTLAVEYILDHAARPEKRPAQLKVECPLVERGSVERSAIRQAS